MKQATYQFNIGLANSDNFPERQWSEGRRAAELIYITAMQGFYIRDFHVVQSDTERTVFMVCSDQGTAEDIAERLDRMASMLGQDCIAVRDESGHGELFGEHPWGAFDHSLFITPKV